MRSMLLRISALLLCSVVLFSCNKPDKKNTNKPEQSYFSIVQYAKDHWDTYYGQPYGIVKKVYFNGTVDSTVTNAIELDWAPILKVFFETDISDDKYIGRYKFYAFRDKITKTNTFAYEAKEEGLYMQKMHISASNSTDKITSIYIEAQKNDRLGTKTVKLLYTPLETISIQEMETSKTGQRKELRVVYEFM